MPGSWREVEVGRQPARGFAELIVSRPIQDRLDQAVTLVEQHDTLYHTWNLRRIDPHRKGTALNLYGPPGTGKSLAAEAIADRLQRTFMEVDYAEMESRYAGETQKNLVRCFELAEARSAVLVFNEADAMLGRRLDNVTQSADHSVNLTRAVLLTQLDRFDGLVVFTTNRPGNYDTAFVRRILAQVRFDLPDLSTRERLWRLLLPAELPQADDIDPAVLAVECEGLSGGDIVTIIKGAAAAAVARPVPRRRVELADLRHEIASLRSTLADVGPHP